MEATKLEIRNVCGIEKLVIDKIGALTLIEGDNGEGKSSVLDAITATLRGPKDVGRPLLRIGAKKGRIRLDLDDGTRIEREFTEKGSTLTVTRKGKKLSKPQAILDGLLDSLSFNPVRFLTAKPKERLDILLETLGADADEEPIHQALAVGDLEASPKPAGQSWIEWADEMRQFAFDERTGVNRQLRETNATVAQLEDSVGDLDEHDYASEIEDSVSQLHGIRESLDAELHRVRAKYASKISEVETTIAELRTKENQAERLAGARELYEDAAHRSTELEGTAESLSLVLTRIDDAKKRVLSKLPVDGLSINGDQIYYKGTPFDSLSESERVVMALRLTADRVGTLPVVCLDGIEALSKRNRDKLAKHAKKMGLQIFAARVTDDALEVVQGDA